MSDIWDWVTGLIGGGSSNIGPVANGSDYANMLSGNSNSIWDSPLLYSSIINAGTGLVGSYFQQSENKSMAEQYAIQKKAELDANLALEREKLAAAKEMAGKGSGAAVAAARIAAEAQRKNTLANLYNNWAGLTERGGEALQQGTSETAQNMTRGMNAIAAKFR